MTYQTNSIRTFIGAKNYDESRAFYQALGFTEVTLGTTMSYFKVSDRLGFYLQNAYVKDWVDNSMVFLEVENLDDCARDLRERNLMDKFRTVRLSAIKEEEWGRELFLHDPSGVLWHFGEFKKGE